MIRYYVHIFAKEDMPDCVCCYVTYEDAIKVCKSLEERNIDYQIWKEH